MSLKKPRGKSWSYWFWKLCDDLAYGPKRMKCRRHNFVLKGEDKRINKQIYQCSGCGEVRAKYN